MTVKRKIVRVCKAAFLGLHGIKASRLKKKVLNFSSDVADNRGKHDNHSQIPDTVKSRIREHIACSQRGKAITAIQKMNTRNN